MTSFASMIMTANNPHLNTGVRTQTHLDHGLNIHNLGRHKIAGIYKFERGSSGTIHIQGYFCAYTKQGYATRTWAKICQLMGYNATAHIEKRRGSHDQAVDYIGKELTTLKPVTTSMLHGKCIDQWQNQDSGFIPELAWNQIAPNKGAGPYYIGQNDLGNMQFFDSAAEAFALVPSRVLNPQPGQRNDLAMVDALIRSDPKVVDYRSLIWEHPEHAAMLSKHHSWAKELIAEKMLRNSASERPVDVIIMWGPPATGKTYYAERNADVLTGIDNARVYKWNPETGHKWFDNYNGQEVLLIDEFYGQTPIARMLNILDVYPMQLEVKGGMTHANWKQVIITSNSDPKEWYYNMVKQEFSIKPEQRRALFSRVRAIYYCTMTDRVANNKRIRRYKREEVTEQWTDTPINNRRDFDEVEEETDIAPAGMLDDLELSNLTEINSVPAAFQVDGAPIQLPRTPSRRGIWEEACTMVGY